MNALPVTCRFLPGHSLGTLLLSAGLCSSPLAIADQALMIGGGYELFASQGQIEQNVAWVREILLAQGLDVSLWYSDGDAPTVDVHYQVMPEQTEVTPLARVFGDDYLDRLRYRNHMIEGVRGSIDADTLSHDLQAVLESTRDVPTLLVYNGHGGQSLAQPDGVTLSLWNDSSMNVRELHALIGAREAPFRYVFTQCYSGGFHRLIHAQTDDVRSPVSGQICGFTAESAYQLSEGCSASINTDDYRDYTTFFFAALDNKARNGSALASDPDLDQNQTVSLREAHLYALSEADSSDIPVASSEQFLDDWQPWSLRWLPARDVPEQGLYARLYRRLAERLGLTADGDTFTQIRTQLQQNQQAMSSFENDRRQQLQAEQGLQVMLSTTVLQQWPQLVGPYTSAFRQLMAAGEFERIDAWLLEQPEYALLQETQARLDAMELEGLELERQGVQYQKLLRLARLAQLEQQLERHGNATDQAAYQALLECENLPLDITGTAPTTGGDGENDS